MTGRRKEMLVVTGMSGAGRSTVGNALEDLGWYVVDNLPPQMIHPLIDLVERAGSNLPNIAAIVDVRGRGFFTELQDTVQQLKTDLDVRVMFLDASDAALVRRFESVRRPHPLQAGGSILDGIATERARLAQIRESSDLVLDTSDLNVHQLAIRVHDTFARADQAGLNLTIMSFGFKYGLPPDADIVLDARFLPNPFWVPELKALTGESDDVYEYVLEQDGARAFIEGIAEALRPVLAGYQRENKRHAMIAIGCTGGKHRSVSLVRALAAELDLAPGVGITMKHRDTGRE
ncbi:MAG TPA: RNase adapter RapZ [Microbacteriaceae bacterium]|nr:RNase adapter RapZ [Microbacteriaceae bacterium]